MRSHVRSHQNRCTVRVPVPVYSCTQPTDETRARRGEFSATDIDSGVESEMCSSTCTTPKESTRALEFHHLGQTPPGHWSGASWGEYERKKRRQGEGPGSGA